MLNFLRRTISPLNPMRLFCHKIKAWVASVFYGFPSKKLIVIGITGTDGKTTTVKMTSDILEQSGHKTGTTSTVYFKIGKREFINTTKKTTLSPFKLQKFLKQTVKAKCKYAVIETSSHSITQGRIIGIAYDVAVITNTSREHLDYHRTMEEYRNTKGLLFKGLASSFRKKWVKKIKILNINDKTYKKFSKFKSDKSFSFGINGKAGIRADKIKIFPDKSVFTLVSPKGRKKICLPVPGEFNIENALAASAVCISQNIPLESIKKTLENFKSVPGRMETVRNNKGFNIIIDYAVSPSAYRKLYATVNNIKKRKNKIVAVFGSCGDRDQGKRPEIGKIVGKYARYCILTNEDPYTENPWQIFSHLETGLKKIGKTEGKNYWKIIERRKAIRMGIALLRRGDFLILTGKGGESNMRIGTRDIPWNERKVVEDELKKI